MIIRRLDQGVIEEPEKIFALVMLSDLGEKPPIRPVSRLFSGRSKEKATPLLNKSVVTRRTVYAPSAS